MLPTLLPLILPHPLALALSQALSQPLSQVSRTEALPLLTILTYLALKPSRDEAPGSNLVRSAGALGLDDRCGAFRVLKGTYHVAIEVQPRG